MSIYNYPGSVFSVLVVEGSKVFSVRFGCLSRNKYENKHIVRVINLVK